MRPPRGVSKLQDAKRAKLTLDPFLLSRCIARSRAPHRLFGFLHVFPFNRFRTVE